MLWEMMHFILMHILRSRYKLPSCKELASSLLDSVDNEMKESVKENLKGREGTLIIEKWSNIHNEPKTASCVQVNRKSYNVDVQDTCANEKTAEILSKKNAVILFKLLKKSIIAKQNA